MAGAQVGRIAGDGGFQYFGRRCVLEQGGKAEPRTRLHRAVVGGQVGGQGIQQVFRFARGTGLQQGQREVEPEFGLVRFGLDRLAQAHHFFVRIDWRRGAFFDHGVLDCRCRLDAVVLEEFAQLAFRQRAGEAIDQLPVLDQHHRRHRADLERGGQFLFGIDIDLGQFEGAVVVGGQLFQHRAQGLARAAPGRPEIHQHRGFQRLADHRVLEGRGGGVEYVRLGGVGHGGLGRCDAMEMAAGGQVNKAM